MSDQPDTPEPEQPDDVDEKRREFLKLCGKLALYTPPVISLLMTPGQDAIAQSGSVRQPPPDSIPIDAVPPP